MLDWQEYRAQLAPFRGARGEIDSFSWGGRPCVNLLGDDFQLPPVLDAPCYDRAPRGPAANHGLLAHDSFGDAVILTEIARQGPGDERLRGVLTRLRTYSLTEEDADWMMSLQVDKIHPELRRWVEDKGLYLFSTHKEEWRWNKQKLQSLNNKGDHPIATIRARNSGAHAKGAADDAAGGLPRSAYLRLGSRCMMTTGVCQEWGLYNGAIGEVVDIVYREGRKPPNDQPAVVLVDFPKYCGPPFLPSLPRVVPVAPVERVLDCRCRCSRTTIPLIPAWGITFRKSQGMTVGEGCDAECVVVHPAAPGFEKSHTGGLYTACSRAKSAGQGEYGEDGFKPSAMYLQPLCSRERILLRVENAQTEGRESMARRISDMAAETRDRYPDAASRFPELVEWARKPLLASAVSELLRID